MSDQEQRSEPDPNQPDQIDQPYMQLDFYTRWIANAIATGERDPSRPIPQPGDLSMLPPALRELVLQSRQEALQEQEQADNDTPQ